MDSPTLVSSLNLMDDDDFLGNSSMADSLEGELHALRAKLDATRQELTRVTEHAAASSVAATASQFEINHLQRALQQVQAEKDTIRASLALQVAAAAQPLPPSPAKAQQQQLAPTSPTLSASSSSYAYDDISKGTVLVQRLREDRDLLRSQLDFAKAEARFQAQAKRDTIREIEDAKAAELSELHVQLMDASAALEEELQAGAKVRMQLQKAREAAEMVEDELEQEKAAREEVEARLAQLEETNARANEDDSGAAEERDEALARVEQLAAALEAATSAKEDAESKLAKVEQGTKETQATAEELEDALAQIDALSAELDAARKERNDEVEQQLTHDHSALVTQLEEEVETLQGRVLRRTQRIGEQDQIIARLEQQLALADVSFDEANETRQIDLPTPKEEGVVEEDLVREEERQAMLGDLADAREALAEAEAEIHALQDELEKSQAQLAHQLEENEKAKAALDAELSSRAEKLSTAEADLATLTTKLNGLEIDRSGSNTEELEKVSRLESDLAQSTAQLETATASLISTQSALEKAEARVVTLEADKVALSGELASSQTRIQQDIARAAQLENQLGEQVQSNRELEAAHALMLEEIGGDFDDVNEKLAQREARIVEIEKAYDQAKAGAEAAQAELAEARAALRTLDSEAQQQHELKNSLEADLGQLKEHVEALEGAKAELRQAVEAADSAKAELSAQLAAARDEAAAAGQDGPQIARLEAQLQSAQREVQALQEQLAFDATSASNAKVAAEEAARREIQMLRQIGRQADQKLDQLQQECGQLQLMAENARVALDRAAQDKAQLEGQLAEQAATSDKHMREVIDTVEVLERDKTDALARVAALSQQVALAAASTSPSEEDAQRLKELEKQLSAQANEMEETEEKYLDVLKTQKRHLGLIEKLKVRVESLQRDLRKATAAIPPPAPTPSRATAMMSPVVARALAVAQGAQAATPVSAGKKRTRPAEEASAGTVVPARAVIAPLPRSATRTAALLRPLDKENANTPSKSPVVLAFKSDTLVPLKAAAAEAPTSAPRTALLERPNVNGPTPVVFSQPFKPTLASGMGALGGGTMSKTDELRARLNAQRGLKARPVA